MTDKELIERAAEAAGVEGEWNGDFGKQGMIMFRNPTTYRLGFDPLNDDGDALRLAVKLGFIVNVDMEEHVTYIDFTVQSEDRTLSEGHGGYPYAATRRAIVRAAAQLA